MAGALFMGSQRVAAQPVCPPDATGTFPDCSCNDVTGIDRVFFPDDGICINAADCPVESGFIVINDQCIRGVLPPVSSPEPGAPVSLPWSGATDGRLNPGADEYYSIFCKNEQVEVWGGVPVPVNVITISFDQLVENLPYLDGDVPAFYTPPGSAVQFSRQRDTMTVYGSSGNGPAHPGQKVFSLTACAQALGRDSTLLFIEPTSQPTLTPSTTTLSTTNVLTDWLDTLVAALATCASSTAALGVVSLPASRILRAQYRDGKRALRRLRRK
jgi:hypothetical protein